MYTDLTTFCIAQGRTIREAMALMDTNRYGIVLVVDGERRLVATVTDGDIRRAVLANIPLDQPVDVLVARKAGSPYARPIAAPVDTEPAACLRLLQEHNILHLPLTDEQQRVVALVMLEEFVPGSRLPLQAVIMAGGYGARLRPLTEDVPKPMLPVGDRPLMEIIIQQLRNAGIQHVVVTTHHKPEKIVAHFGDGEDYGIQLSYIAEDRPLGTVGGLGLMAPPQETTLVINGDILTQVDFRAMLAFHREHGADLTVAVRRFEFQIPYGVVECDGPAVRRLTEKPVTSTFVNAGIYLLEPVVHRFIPAGERFDMTELIQRLLDERRPVVGFPIREYWLDIGNPAEYRRAQKDARDLETGG